MKPISKRTALSALLALSLSLLAACASTPQAESDGIDDLSTLADGNGDIEATLKVVSVGSSNSAVLQGVSSNTYLKVTYEFRKRIDKSTPLVGMALVENQVIKGSIGVAVAPGDEVKIRGRVRKVGNVPAFTGFMRSQTTGVGAAATTPPTPVILLAEGKTLPTKTQSAVTLTNVQITSYAIEIDGQMAGWLRTSDGKVASYRVTSPRDSASGLPIGIVFQAKFNGQVESVQTQVGVVGKLTGTLSSGQKTVSIEGITAVDDWETPAL